jgi:hypothetical protein
MATHCPICSDSHFRLSKLRSEDFWHLAFLMYPVRCLDCLQRRYLFLPLAILFKSSPARVHKHQKA